VFKCPSDPAACAPGSTATSYVAIVGKRASWRHYKAESAYQKLYNQPAEAFLVIERANSGIQWTEPKDIKFDNVHELQSLAATSPHTRYNGYFYYETPAVNAALVHGDMVFVFPSDSRISVLTGLLPTKELLLPPEELRRIERSRGKYDPYSHLFREELLVNWPHLVGLPVWIVAVAMLTYQGLAASRRQHV
jgi:hypothetical protein